MSKGKKVLPVAVSPTKSVPSAEIPTIAPRLLRIPEAAAYLSATTWYVEELVRGNKLPFVVVGKYRVIDVRDLDAWINAEKRRQAKNPPTPVGFAKIRRKLGTAA